MPDLQTSFIMQKVSKPYLVFIRVKFPSNLSHDINHFNCRVSTGNNLKLQNTSVKSEAVKDLRLFRP
jgi:hypothetical protein